MNLKRTVYISIVHKNVNNIVGGFLSRDTAQIMFNYAADIATITTTNTNCDRQRSTQNNFVLRSGDRWQLLISDSHYKITIHCDKWSDNSTTAEDRNPINSSSFNSFVTWTIILIFLFGADHLCCLTKTKTSYCSSPPTTPLAADETKQAAELPSLPLLPREI